MYVFDHLIKVCWSSCPKFGIYFASLPRIQTQWVSLGLKKERAFLFLNRCRVGFIYGKIFGRYIVEFTKSCSLLQRFIITWTFQLFSRFLFLLGVRILVQKVKIPIWNSKPSRTEYFVGFFCLAKLISIE